MLTAGVMLGIAGIAGGELGRVDLGAASSGSLISFAYLVVIGSIVAFSAYAWLLQNVRISLVSTYAYVNPVVAVALGAVFLAEPVGAVTLVAGAAIVLAVGLIVTARPPRPKPVPEELPEPLRAAA